MPESSFGEHEIRGLIVSFIGLVLINAVLFGAVSAGAMSGDGGLNTSDVPEVNPNNYTVDFAGDIPEEPTEKGIKKTYQFDTRNYEQKANVTDEGAWKHLFNYTEGGTTFAFWAVYYEYNAINNTQFYDLKGLDSDEYAVYLRSINLSRHPENEPWTNYDTSDDVDSLVVLDYEGQYADATQFPQDLNGSDTGGVPWQIIAGGEYGYINFHDGAPESEGNISGEFTLLTEERIEDPGGLLDNILGGVGDVANGIGYIAQLIYWGLAATISTIINVLVFVGGLLVWIIGIGSFLVTGWASIVAVVGDVSVFLLLLVLAPQVFLGALLFNSLMKIVKASPFTG